MKYLKSAVDWIYEPKEISRFEQIAIHALLLNALWSAGFNPFKAIG